VLIFKFGEKFWPYTGVLISP